MSVRRPDLFEAAPGITGIDTFTGGNREFNAVYLIAAHEPTLVEAASGADARVVEGALARLGIGPRDLAHIVVTHVHVDHAGGAGRLAERYPEATVWVHERGAPHLADPSRLVASTARTYGEARMLELYGTTAPTPSDRLRAVRDGDTIRLGSHRLDVLYTPGHASHHVALHEPTTGVVFTGEAIGSHLPWADCYRPALPPPEVDVEQALGSIERIRGLHASAVLASHFGPIDDAEEACVRGAERVRTWSEAVRAALVADPTVQVATLTATLTAQASREYLADAGEPIDLARYDAIGSIGMNAAGLARYWRKRWGLEEAPTDRSS